MENASKALLMAAGVLIGILLLSLMVSLFVSSRNVENEYEKTKQSEAVQQFNTNFTKYLGQELTIHQVVTICNFADNNNITISGGKKITDLELEVKTDYTTNIPKYKLQIESYNNEGYINKIKFTEVN